MNGRSNSNKSSASSPFSQGGVDDDDNERKCWRDSEGQWRMTSQRSSRECKYYMWKEHHIKLIHNGWRCFRLFYGNHLPQLNYETF